MIKITIPLTQAKGNLSKLSCQGVKRRPPVNLLLKVVLLCQVVCAAMASAAFEGLNEDAVHRFPASVIMLNPTHDRIITLERRWRFGLPELSVNRFGALVFHDGLIGTTGWAYTGDRLYNESVVHFGCGMKSKKLAGIVCLQSYNLNIDGYGSSSCIDESLELHCMLTQGAILSAGLNGLTLSGNSKLQEDVERRFWVSIEVYSEGSFSIRGLGEASRNHRTSLSIALRTSITKGIWGGFSAGENPTRAGIILAIQVHPFIIDISSSCAPPLGWSNGLRISYQW